MNCKKCGNKVYAKEVCNCGEKAPNPHKIAVSVNTIICTFFLVIATIAFILSFTLRDIVNHNLIVKTVEQVDLSSIEIKLDDETIKLNRLIYDEFIQDNSEYSEFIDSDKITLENVDNVLNAPFIKEFLIDKIEGYQDFFMDRGEMEHLTSDDIVNLIFDNKEILYNETGLEFEESDRQSLKNDLSGLDEFSDFCDDYLTGWLTGGLIQMHFSGAYLIFLAAFMLIILIQWLVVYIFNGRRVYKALRKYGITVIIPSALFLLASISCILYKDISIVETLVSKIAAFMLAASLIMVAAGLTAIIISMIMSKNAKKKALSANVNVTDDETFNADASVNETSAPLVNDKNEAKENMIFTPFNDNEYKSFAPTADMENKEPDASSDEDKKHESKPENVSEKSENTDSEQSALKEISQNNQSDKTEDKKLNTEKNLNSNECICPSCGKANKENSAFCRYCGSKIS